METETKPTKKILIRIAEKLSEAQQEIDELTVQLALGKAEAKDKFEDIKKEFRSRLNEFRQYLATLPSDTELSGARAIVDTLEKELEQGEASTQEAFASQQKKILTTTVSLQNTLKKKPAFSSLSHDFIHELEKFKIKLEIVHLRFGLRKMEIKDEFRDRMDEARKHVDKIRERVKESVISGKDMYEDFREEIQLAYKHFRKALKEL